MNTSDELLSYYHAELGYLRRAGAEFARRHPKAAARLELGPEECPDPHVERLIESVAFLTGPIPFPGARPRAAARVRGVRVVAAAEHALPAHA